MLCIIIISPYLCTINNEINNNKMTTITDHAAAAKMIRTELKALFPSVKFSVKSKSFSGGDAVRVKWENGPTKNEVSEITGKYQAGSFNSMEDIYEYDNDTDLPTVKYITTSRDYTESAIADVAETFGIDLNNLDAWNESFRAYNREIVLRKLSEINLV